MAKPPVRIIARLDIKGENVIKGVQLEGLRIIGKPGPIARRYYEQGIDEIFYIDVVASLYGRNSILEIVREAARNIFVPLTVGGGIRKKEDIISALRSGADKVAINTAAVRNPSFIKDAAESFGSQCIVVSVEAKKRAPGQWEVLTDNGRELTGRSVVDWVTEVQELGAGEIFLTSVDKDGTRTGFDSDLIRAVYDRVNIPVVASGGAGNVGHISRLLTSGCVDAVCVATMFHYEVVSPETLKQALRNSGHCMRPLEI